MPGAFIKDIYREIINTKGRFFGILAIVLLGVAFFAGLGATGYDMQLTGYTYFNTQQLMDIRVISTYGLNDNDVKAISRAEGVEYAFATYSMDAQVTHNGITGNIKLHAYDRDAAVNQPVLVAGALPQKSNETVVEAGMLGRLGYAIGDKITLQSGKSSDIRNKLRNRTYIITGVVETPYYISRERGTSSIGRGEVDYYMLIPQANFLSDVYSEVFVRVEGADLISCFDDAYKDKIDAVSTVIEDIGKVRVEERAREMTAKAYDQLREAELALDQNMSDTRLLLDEAEVELSDAAESIPSVFTELTDTLTDIVLQEQQIDESLAQITSALGVLRDTETQLSEQEQSLWTSYYEVLDYEAYLGADFLDRVRDINDGLKAVSDARQALTEQKQSLYRSFNELTDGRRELREALNTVYDGGRSLVTGNYALAQQEASLAAERITLLTRLDEAQQALTETRKTLDDLDDPKWYVLDRDANPGYASFSDDTSKIEAIGRVFPLIFFIVAALVCLTSMTRLVEERRTEIGTLKSLGYGNAAILSKYMIYALLPTLLGGLAGGYIGMKLFPTLIIDAYNMLYTTPPPITPMNITFWSLGLLMGLAATGLATIFVCVYELRDTPAGLMRPKAPKAGKRTLIERLPFVWHLLNFTQKVTVRNLLRYKKRMLMTVIGIGGCTALLLTGFGIRDSVADIINKQFGEINHYNMVISFSDNAPAKDITHANNVLVPHPIYRRSVMTRQKTMDAGIPGGSKTYQAILIVPESVNGLEHFFTFKDRATQEHFTLNDNGVIITEKLSRLLNVKENDLMLIKDGDDIIGTVRVAAVMETYFMHYIYMTPALYQSLFNEKPEFNTIFAIISTDDAEQETELARTLLDEKSVNGVSFVQSSIDSFVNVISNLNFVIYVLIISAGALALVVLLNLTNININERIRELATIEVLGFYDREVSAYIYRENAILTFMGAIVGLGIGYFLHLYIILTVETDTMIFSRDIKPLSYLYAVALTFFFAFIVNMMTANKLKKINMVEALKSVE